jgi:hypothetical protein
MITPKKLNIDGTETKLANGTNTTVSGNGSIATPYQVNTPTQVQADWNQSTITALDYIKNKPTIPIVTANNGTSKVGNNVQLGNDTSLTTATLLSDREIPTAGFSVNLTGAGNFGVERNAGQSAQSSIHIGNTSFANGAGSRTIVYAESIDSSKYIPDNVFIGGTNNLADSSHLAILNGDNIKIKQTQTATATTGLGNSNHSVAGSSQNVSVLNAQFCTVYGVKRDTGSGTQPSKVEGKFSSGLLSTTNGWILGTTTNGFWHNGDNNEIIGGHDNQIGGVLTLDLTNPFAPVATPTVSLTESDNYADDSLILGSQFSYVTDTGNAIIISGEQNYIRGAVRSSMISCDKSFIRATTRNVSGGQDTMLSTLQSSVKDCNYTSLISVASTNIDGSIGAVKDRSMAIAGTGLKIGKTDQLVHGTYNEGRSDTTYEQGIGTSGTPKNGVVHRNNGCLGLVNLATDPTGSQAGDMYYNTTVNRPKFYNGTTWTTL